ncbi:hypothetical protein [Tetragenococcus koreensis]|uniref:Uncharacterized protein n=1 Tax=Tetragenococcus koreensis TaxID=290335 RepID=A0AAN4UB18_9ENTE|nr:hypothetical protein [Tetragenococcus koreensis]MDN6640782.1 hypothetical protein [Tetragenococcus sp.]MCF1584379.1 hypothetical protein [Tetragenococcus koreensis]MCF1613928.1 hypothetical protein [Tetragenococcus koreensis]MCF1623706.1 hypothetical protein [Tetragenococcus koreensis]MCF1626694.1 hypothetical protein [Tetragenococcus koreensis]
MARKKKEVTFKQVFLWSSFLMIIHLLFQNLHWINILWGLLIVPVIVPTAYYFINGRSFKPLNYENSDYFNGIMGFFVLLSVALIILITVFIGVFAPNLL